jgi:hypothetical protein
LNQGAYIMPFYDVKIGHPHFETIQRIGATGMLRGTGKPNAWANQTWFYPDSTIQTNRLSEDIKAFTGNSLSGTGVVTTTQALEIAKTIAVKFQVKNEWAWGNQAKLNQQVADSWKSWGFGEWRADAAITRLQFAKLLDATVNPFALLSVNHQGQFELKY